MARPRVYVSLDHETYKVLNRMCSIMGMSKSELIGRCMDEVAPNLAEFIEIVEKLGDENSVERHPTRVARLLSGAELRLTGLADACSGTISSLRADLDALEEEAMEEGIINRARRKGYDYSEELARRGVGAPAPLRDRGPLSINKGAKTDHSQ